MNTMRKNVGLIGISGYGAIHLENLLKLEDEGKAKLAAAVVINPEETAEQCAKLSARGCRIFPDPPSMYSAMPELDVIGIPTGIASHEPLLREALSRRHSVLVEKPASGTAASVRRMIDAERNSGGCFAAVGFQYLHAPGVRRLRDLLDGHAVGRIRRIAAIGLSPRNDDYFSRNSWAGRLHDAAGVPIYDSPANNAFAHFIMMALFFAGPDRNHPASCRIRSAELRRARKMESFDNCHFSAVTESGIELDFFFSLSVEKKYPQTVRVLGDRGMLEWQFPDNWTVFDTAGNPVDSGAETGKPTQLWEDVLKRTDDPATFVCTLGMAMEQTACIEALHQKFTIQDIPDSELRRIPEQKLLTAPVLERRFIRMFRECTDPGGAMSGNDR